MILTDVLALLDPQAAPLLLDREDYVFTVGLIPPYGPEERRVALTPDDVALLTRRGIQVFYEPGYGVRSSFEDVDYILAGAVERSRAKLLECNVLLSIDTLLPKDIALLNRTQILASTFNTLSMPATYIDSLMDRGVCALAYDFVEDPAKRWNLVEDLDEVAARSLIQVASTYLAKHRGLMLGGTSRLEATKVTIIGKDRLCESCYRVLKILGAEVVCFNPYAVIDSFELTRRLSESMVVIVNYRHPDHLRGCIITEDQVMQMPLGSLIIDATADHGCSVATAYPTSHKRPFYEIYGVRHYAVPNITSMMPQSASRLISAFNCFWLTRLCECSDLESLIYEEVSFSKGVYVYANSLCNHQLGRHFEKPYDDILNLL